MSPNFSNERKIYITFSVVSMENWLQSTEKIVKTYDGVLINLIHLFQYYISVLHVISIKIFLRTIRMSTK